MIYERSATALVVFVTFVAAVLVLSFWLGRRAKSAGGYFAAHGQVGWFVNGIAFAGDYLSAASFLGICGMIAFYGYDGFLYSIGYLAGWIVALFVIAEPIRRLGTYTFADALDARFRSKGIKIAAAVSTLVISLFYLTPQMVGAGTLVKTLLGLPHWTGVLLVGVSVTLIVVTAGMVSTTWVQFIKGSLLVLFCTILVGLILSRGFTVASGPGGATIGAATQAIGADGKPSGPFLGPANQSLEVAKDGSKRINGAPQSLENQLDSQLRARFGTGFGSVAKLPGGVTSTGPLDPLSYLSTFARSTVITWGKQESVDPTTGAKTTVFHPREQQGSDLLLPGASPTFKGVRAPEIAKKLDFFSLMIALFLGTASLPHILIRYYTVKDVVAARRSTVVGIAAIGLFYVLTLYLGLGAMTSGALDPTDSNSPAPLLARSFSETLFAIISAIAFTTILGTVSGLVMAGAGAVAHDLCANVFGIMCDDRAKVRCAKCAAVGLGAIAMVLGILFEKLNVSFLVGWAFNIAASANLPSLVMLLFWRRTTKQGIIAAILVGMVSSLGWVLLSADAFEKVYGFTAAEAMAKAPVPFSQPALVTIPLGFLTLVAVSLLTSGRGSAPAPVARAA